MAEQSPPQWGKRQSSRALALLVGQRVWQWGEEGLLGVLLGQEQRVGQEMEADPEGLRGRRMEHVGLQEELLSRRRVGTQQGRQQRPSLRRQGAGRQGGLLGLLLEGGEC